MLVFITLFMAACLAVSNAAPTPQGSVHDVLGGYIGVKAVGACELPDTNYTTPFAIALGDVPELGELKWTPGYCGHIFHVDCGHGAIDAIVINSDIGGGINIYPSAWNESTGAIRPTGGLMCSVSRTDKNAFVVDTPQCYHSTGEINNAFFRKIALFNTKGKIVVGATLNGVDGAQDGPFFMLNVKASGNDAVTFAYEDGTDFVLPLHECQDGSKKKVWL